MSGGIVLRRSAKDAKKAKAPKLPKKARAINTDSFGERRKMKKIMKADIKEAERIAKDLNKRRKKIEKKQNTIVCILAIVLCAVSKLLDELIKRKKLRSES